MHRSNNSEILSQLLREKITGMSTEYQKKLANSLRARKSHVTSRGKHLQEALDNLSIDSPAILCSRLKESLNRYEGAVKGVEETYVQLEEEVDGAMIGA